MPNKMIDYTDKKLQINNEIFYVKNLSFYYSKKNVLNNINLSVGTGSIVNVIGPNGGGKTTLVRILAKIYKNYAGTVSFVDNTAIGYLPQHFVINQLIPMTVKYFLLSNFTMRNIKINIDEVLQSIDISKILESQISEISSGELQLVLLARCLMISPNLIILDEPVSYMDTNAKENFYKLIGDLVNKYNMSIIMTSHDLQFVLSSNNRFIYLNRSIHFDGYPKDIPENESINTMFSKY